ncbi:hypothetical protein [Rummeliibacillus sp. TYF005]|uniref:hypothetical protein n=1 Tax=Rummeliibacillus sp. TYF005 TaxID=2058214 RepID=UPI000F533447|nr:hypothetical protein [Rummeliibacillus sp. TYF005]RPJ94863.1 hypothetical protein CW357_13375 [Rummeliibacillus sp. TYF005]
MLLISGFWSLTKGTKDDVNTSKSASQQYNQLTSILSSIEGVGKVMVYFYYDQPSGEAKNDDTSSLSQYFSWQQNAESKQKVTGVLVVAEGADSITVKKDLVTVLSSVLEIPSHRIVVRPMEKKED